jgi:hypothetical protein
MMGGNRYYDGEGPPRGAGMSVAVYSGESRSVHAIEESETLLQTKRVWMQKAIEAAQSRCRLSNDTFHEEQRVESV